MNKIYQKGFEIFGDQAVVEGDPREELSCGYLSFFADKKLPNGTYDLRHLWETEDGEEDRAVKHCNLEERKWIEDARQEGIVSEVRLIQLLGRALRLKARSAERFEIRRLVQ